MKPHRALDCGAGISELLGGLDLVAIVACASCTRCLIRTAHLSNHACHLLVCIEVVDEVLLVVLGPDDSTLSRSEAGRDQVLVGGASLWRSLITRGTSTARTRGAAWVQSLASILSMKQ